MDKGRHGRKDRLIKEKRHDVYRERQKLPEPTLCTGCQALFQNGRWTWQTTDDKPNEAVCPACKRISDGLPAGHVELGGDFFKEHREEILNLVRNVEQQEKNQHPLERIMAIDENRGRAMVTTTGIHIARRIAEALSHSYKGDLSLRYPEEEAAIRVSWMR